MISLIKTLLIQPIFYIVQFIFTVTLRYTGDIIKAKFAVAFIILLMVLLFIWGIIDKRKNYNCNSYKVISKLISIGNQKGFAFLMCALAIFMGLYIPSNTLQVSPVEFYTHNRTVIRLLFNVFLTYIGLFLIWCNIIYFLSPRVLRGIEKCLFLTYLLCGIINYYVYNTKNGIISSLFVYDKKPFISNESKVAGLVLFIAVFVAVYLFLSKISTLDNNSVIKSIGLFLSMVFLAMSLTCIFRINSELSKEKIVVNKELKEYEQIIPLSTEGKNVVVIMLDKAVSGYVPFIFNEKPYLKEKFDGFTYYPNTLTFAGGTICASPALYGGYEYTPINMNKRKDETLKDKHNEAITVLPLLFAENGFSSNVYDPPYAGYRHIIDLSIYDKYPNIKAYNTSGVYKSPIQEKNNYYFEEQQENAIFWYSVYRTQTPILQNLIYNEGTYNYSRSNDYFRQPFLDEISVLSGMSELTEVKQDDSNNFIIMDNESTHEPVHLSIDECENYVMSHDYDYSNKDREVDGKIMHIYNETTYNFYVTNIISYVELGNWFDYLREQGIYDNTRIIIVSDHGVGEKQFDYEVLSNGLDLQQFNSVLMVKDFDAKGFNVNEELMTIADVPFLATNEVIDNPKNPFTGNSFFDSNNKEEIMVISLKGDNEIVGNDNIKQFDIDEDKSWRFSGDNIFEEKNWSNK